MPVLSHKTIDATHRWTKIKYDRKSTYHVTLRYIHATIVDIEKQ